MKQQRKNHVEWSIHSDTKSENVDEWVEANSVGHIEDGYCVIPNLKDGTYQVKQTVYWYKGNYIPGKGIADLKTKVTVADGKISKDDCLNAVDEFISLTGDHHYFIESIRHDTGSDAISFFLGS